MPEITENELTFKNRGHAFQVADLILQEGYAVMITEEEDLIVVNFVYAGWGSGQADRNNMIFMSREEWDAFLLEQEETEK